MPLDQPTDEPGQQVDPRRRRILASLGLLGLFSVGGVAGHRRLTRRTPPSTELVSNIPLGELRELADRYAPDLYFDIREKWFPTDALLYSTERDGETVVDGFHALIEYTGDYHDGGLPPAPVVYWHAHDATDDIFAIQYWMYSVFDQFTVNFHWHDWELLQVFIDAETREPVLISASAHSRASPNNEALHPSMEQDRRPIILAELGSHSSAIDMNERIPSFDRLPDGSLQSDITNDIVSVTQRIDLPFAYGLPRDEGAPLPMVLPELDGVPIYEHPRLVDVVDREDFIDEDVTVREWRDLARPPSDLPMRQSGLVMTHPDSATSGDLNYELRPMAEVEGIAAFTGPQLSFEFPIPAFAEELYADHITSVGIPWEQPRYTDPLDDVSDFQHRLAVQGYEADELLNRVVGRFTMLTSGPDGAVDDMSDTALAELAELVTVSRRPLPVELAVRLASPHPVMVATNNGVFGFLHVALGEHLLGAIGPGLAPVAVRFTHEGGTVNVGAAGRLTVVANEAATWIRGRAGEMTEITQVRIVEDFAGPVYEGLPVDGDRFAVAVHRDGQYIVEVVDRDGVRGAHRVNPGERDSEIIFEIETGRRSLIRALVDYLATTVELAMTLCDDCALLDTYIGPQHTSFDDAASIRASMRRNIVALEDRVAVRLETAGMPGWSVDATLQAISVEIRQIEGHGTTTVLGATDPGISVLGGDTGVYVAIDMSETEVRFVPGQTWEVAISLPDHELLEYTMFEVVERRVDLARAEPLYEIYPSEDAVIAGRSTMAPGTVLTVQTSFEDESFRAQDVAINESGRFGARFDFSNRRVGESFGIEVWEGDRAYLFEEGVFVEVADEDVQDVEDEPDRKNGVDVVRLIAKAESVADGLLVEGVTHEETDLNTGLGEVRSQLEQVIELLLEDDRRGFTEAAAQLLVRRMEIAIERVDEAVETRV